MKAALFAFNGEPMCFVHVLLNAFDMKEKGYEVKIVVEGSAAKLVKDFSEDDSLPFASLWKKALEEGLISCVCQACATKMGSLEHAKKLNLELCAEMSGHPSIARFEAEGYKVYTF